MQAVFEKIIERLENASFLTDSSFDEDGYCNDDSEEAVYLHEAIEIVKKEAEQYNNGWIPCSSGVMPRANGWYLVTNYLGVVQEQRWSANHWEKLRDEAVLAWRELPLPYQPNGE